MMRFEYEAFAEDGRTMNGALEADGEEQVWRLLRRRGLTPIRVSTGTVKATKRRTRRMRSRDVALAFQEMGMLLQGGLSIAEAVDAVAKSRGDAVGAIFETVATRIRQGEAPGTAFRAAAPKLPGYAHALLDAGSKTGAMGPAAEAVGAQLSFDESLRDEVRTALIYPGLLAGFGFAAVIFILAVVVPRFGDLFERAESLSWMSLTVYGASTLLTTRPVTLAVILLAAVFAITAALRNPSVRARVLNAACKAPILGDWIREADAARWTTVMGGLLKARADVLEALDLASQGLIAPRAKTVMHQVKRAVGQGRRMADALAEQSALPPTTIGLVRSGEQAGALPKTLEAASEIHVAAVRRTAKRFLTLVEPAAILLVGAAIGFVAIAVLSAISSFSDIGL